MSNPLNNNIGNMQFNNATPNPNIAQFKNMISMLKTASNPTAMLQMLSQNNPQLAQVMQLCQGKNPEQVFRSMCAQKGINPDDIINQLK